jgi:septum site-determining protein MinC
MTNVTRLEEDLIDLSTASTPTNVLLEITNMLEKNNLKGSRIRLILGDIILSPDHMLSLKRLLNHSGVELEAIYTKSLNTQLAALSAGLMVSELPSKSKPEPKSVNYKDNVSDTQVETEETTCVESNEQYKTEKVLEEILSEEEETDTPKQHKSESSIQTLYLKQTLRSGQTINFDGNIVIIGDCHSGSEIIASGDITVWGILSGIAHAGNTGDSNASIRALKINAIQLRIADLIARKPDRFRLEKVEKAASFVPEEARITGGEIKIYFLNG